MNRIKNSFKSRKARLAQMAALASVAVMSSPAMAQASNWDAFFDAVDFTGVSAKVIVGGVAIVAIAIAYKGPDLAKRLVKKA